MARKKLPALEVPATIGEAREVMERYVGDDRDALKVKLHYEAAIDRLKAERDLLLIGIDAVQKQRFAALKAWWEAGGKDLAGKKRSAELAGAKIGVRLTTPKVKFARGIRAEAVIHWLGRVVGGPAFLRTKIELDKEAVIKAMRAKAPMAGPLADRGVTVIQTDEFFIDAGLEG